MWHYSFATTVDVVAAANPLVDEIRRAQFRATTVLPVSTSCRGELLLNIKVKLQQKRRLLKLLRSDNRPGWRKFEESALLLVHQSVNTNNFGHQSCRSALLRCSNSSGGDSRLSRKGYLFLSPAELLKIVLRLPKKKASGPDDVSTAALKHLTRRTIVAMKQVFNGILHSGHFPDTWKRGNVIMISKAGKGPRRRENLRHITLLPHVAKTFERDLLFLKLYQMRKRYPLNETTDFSSVQIGRFDQKMLCPATSHDVYFVLDSSGQCGSGSANSCRRHCDGDVRYQRLGMLLDARTK
ncbi:Probable RNA-directed DNA polymerase from transposon X-element [Eumeta japonica]|uniref:Probable RNA-directed DNA polymerase from transposon X-element n=1 Tax=Eumeta variegata TaxID=151549 RepID=A0A4C1Z4I3_EUMVA|nr:Probable RNA-directed DNA polymerase from transposon X-element [Eumeta japonica]